MTTTIKAKKLPVTTFGLMGKEKAYPICFKTRFGIHTFFLKFPIDVLILKNDKVVKAREQLLPNKFFFWNPKYNDVVELPSGSIKRKGIKLGKKVRLVTH